MKGGKVKYKYGVSYGIIRIEKTRQPKTNTKP